MAQLKLHNDFESILEVFNELIHEAPSLSKVKSEILEIKEFATTASSLTGRQREAITERCDNYLNGTYGRNLSTVK